MPHTITQNSSILSNSLSVPSDGIDPVNENSVDPVFQRLVNNDFYVGYNNVWTKPYLYATSAGGTTVSIGAFNGLWISPTNTAVTTANWQVVSNLNTFSLTAANLDTGGPGFANSTAYYIYVLIGSPGVATFECSLEKPIMQNTFKGPAMAPDYSRRYFGSFSTNSAGEIINYYMLNNDYFTQAIAASNFFHSASAASTTFTFDPFTLGFPATMRQLKFYGGLFAVIPVTVGNDGSVTFFSTTYPTIKSKLNISGGVGYKMGVDLTLPIIAADTLSATIISDGTTTIGFDLFLHGYKE